MILEPENSGFLFLLIYFEVIDAESVFQHGGEK